MELFNFYLSEVCYILPVTRFQVEMAIVWEHWNTQYYKEVRKIIRRCLQQATCALNWSLYEMGLMKVDVINLMEDAMIRHQIRPPEGL